MLTLAIGDLHVPTRAVGIPLEFRKLLAPNDGQIPANSKISQVLCLGNVTGSAETLAFLHGISRSFHIVTGEGDDVSILGQELKQLDGKDHALATYGIVNTDGLRIGFTNGYLLVPRSDPMALLMLARELDVDILVWGGTHQVEAYTLDGKFFVNPGSASGAYTFEWPEDYDEDDGEENDNKNDKIDTDDKDKQVPSENAEEKDENAEVDAKDEGDGNVKGDEIDGKSENAKSTEDGEEGANENDAAHSEEAKEDEPQNSDKNRIPDASTGDSVAKDDKVKENEGVDEKFLSLSLDKEQKSVKLNLFGEEREEPQEETGLTDDEIDNDIIEKAAELTSSKPSFCLLDTHGLTCTLFIYTYVQGQVKVDKVVYNKEP